VNFDAGLTQNFMSNVSGGIDTGDLQYTGSLDLWVNLDTAKLTNALWPGATVFLHGERRWNNGVQPDAGSAIPPVFEDTMPDPLDDNGFYLSEYYLVQALSPKVSVWMGQMNGAGLVDGNAFANDDKHQFMNIPRWWITRLLGRLHPTLPLTLRPCIFQHRSMSSSPPRWTPMARSTSLCSTPTIPMRPCL